MKVGSNIEGGMGKAEGREKEAGTLGGLETVKGEGGKMSKTFKFIPYTFYPKSCCAPFYEP